MKNILVVTSSVRDGRNASKILSQVKSELKKYPEFKVNVADFKEMPLPFIDSSETPSSESFEIKDKNVQKWADMVAEADAVILLVAEYNHSYTPVLKNAIDWLYEPWKNKPVALIGYGWVGGARAIKHLRDVLASNLSAQPLDTEANLRFTKEIDLDGTPIDDSAKTAINQVLQAI